MNKNSKIYVAGHTGLVGGALFRLLQKAGYSNVLVRTHQELDLENQKAVEDFFQKERPEYVFLCAAKVGGIKDNSEKPVEFLYANLQIQNNVITSAYNSGNLKKLLFMGSSCIYPRLSEQPIKEEYFMTGKLEPTNEAYSVAKIAGIALCQAYKKEYGVDMISVMPANVYGPGDHFDTQRSHVIPALLRRFDDAKKQQAKNITLWGTGNAVREFIHCDDLALATLFAMNNYNEAEILNIGTGSGVSIKELSEKVKAVVGFEGEMIWDTTKPDGMPIRLLDAARLLALGWKHSIELDEGLKGTYAWFTQNVH